MPATNHNSPPLFFDTVRLRRSFPPLESSFPFGDEEVAEVASPKKATTKRKETAAIFMMIVGEDVGELSYV